MSFSDMGYAKAERDIEDHEDHKPSVDSPIKPFTTKVPSHVIEALDLVASSMNISRNTLVSKLINQFLGQAFCDYHLGYKSVFNIEESEQKYVIGQLKPIDDSGVSEEARIYLSSAVLNSVQDL